MPLSAVVRALSLAALLPVGLVSVAHAEAVSTLADQTGVAVTIYNSNLALVRDSRRVTLDAGVGQLAWREVSAQMRPETALLTGAASVVEQNFDFDLLTPQKLLEKYLGKTVSVIRTHPTTGTETRESAVVLATNNGVVLQFADRIETGAPGRIAFPDVPATLRDQPTLVLTLDTPRAGAQPLALAYLTGGLGWRADYVAELATDETTLDLSGWVTLTNQSGASYPDARLQLVAGDVNQVQEHAPSPRAMMAMAKSVEMDMQQEALLDYHLYTLPRPTSILDNQTKQVALLSADGVASTKDYVLDGVAEVYGVRRGDAIKQKVGVYLAFQNRGAGLGVPLPRGVVRVYKKDRAGNAQFVGEDRIDHTPNNDTVRLKLGDAFDLTAERTQTDYKKLGGGNDGQIEAAMKIVLKNAKDEAATVSVRETLPGDWTLVETSHTHRKLAAGLAEWRIAVPAGGEATLTYRVRTRL